MGEWLAGGQRMLASGRRKRARQAGLGLALACGGGRERVHYYLSVASAVLLLLIIGSDSGATFIKSLIAIAVLLSINHW